MSEVPQEVVNDYNTPETEPVDMDMDSLQAYQEFVRSTKAYDAEYALVYPILGLTNEGRKKLLVS